MENNMNCEPLLFSVIVPAYNVEKYINDCLDSILNQTYKLFEIIVVNDGSTDNTLEIVNEYNDSRLKIINKSNGGLSSARNTGINTARGKYILHVDGDDFIDKCTLENYYNKIANAEYDVIISDIYKYDGNTHKMVDYNINENIIFDGIQYLKEALFNGKGCFSVCNKLWNRNLYIDNNILHNENISLGEDGNASVKLFLNANRISKINFVSYYYRMNPSSMTQKQCLKLNDYYESYLNLLKYSELINDDFFINNQYSFLFYSYYIWVVNLTDFELSYNKSNDIQYVLAKKRLLEDKKKLLFIKMKPKLKIIIIVYNISPRVANFMVETYNKLKDKY